MTIRISAYPTQSSTRWLRLRAEPAPSDFAAVSASMQEIVPLSRSALVGAVDEVLGEQLQRISGSAKRLDGREGVGDQLVGVSTRSLDAIDGRPGRLDTGGVLAGGIAAFFRRLRHLQDVVNDLEREAGLLAEGADAGKGACGH